MGLRAFVSLFILLGLALAGGASADETRIEKALAHHRIVEVLEHIDRPEPGKGWVSFHLDHVAVHKKTGLAYTRRLDLGERGMTSSVRGPALDRKKSLGLSVELRF